MRIHDNIENIWRNNIDNICIDNMGWVRSSGYSVIPSRAEPSSDCTV
jgi:hypothetical protein